MYKQGDIVQLVQKPESYCHPRHKLGSTYTVLRINKYDTNLIVVAMVGDNGISKCFPKECLIPYFDKSHYDIA